MKLEKLREISETLRKSHCVCECCCEKCHCSKYEKLEARNEAAIDHFDALLDLVEACRHNPCRHSSGRDACDVCEAIAKLEEVK